MIKFFAFTSFFVLAVPFFVHAHADGRSVEKQVGKYLLDIGYNTDPIVAGESTYFDFKLYEKVPTPGVADFTDVWVRIEKEKQTLFATGVSHMPVGATGMLYTFAEEGTHAVSARYERNGETLAETTFFVDVKGKAKELGPLFFLEELGAFLVGGLVSFGVYAAYLRRKPRGIV